MSNDSKITVMIGGSSLTLVGTESEEYMIQIAKYINQKINTIRRTTRCVAANSAMMNMLISVNIADDYFKARDEASERQKALLKATGDINKLSEEAGALKQKNESLMKETDQLRDEMNALLKRLAAAESEVVKAKNELNEYVETFDKRQGIIQ